MKGIIYKIECNETNEVYYGSTQQSLKKRIEGHQRAHKRWKEGKYHFVTSFDIMDRGNYSYSLIETVECKDIKQLEARERYYIENNECINKYVPGRTTKEYYKDNKDVRLHYQKDYYVANIDKIKEQKKAYNEANKEQKKEYNKQRYLKQKQLKEQTN